MLRSSDTARKTITHLPSFAESAGSGLSSTPLWPKRCGSAKKVIAGRRDTTASNQHVQVVQFVDLRGQPPQSGESRRSTLRLRTKRKSFGWATWSRVPSQILVGVVRRAIMYGSARSARSVLPRSFHARTVPRYVQRPKLISMHSPKIESSSGWERHWSTPEPTLFGNAKNAGINGPRHTATSSAEVGVRSAWIW